MGAADANNWTMACAMIYPWIDCAVVDKVYMLAWELRLDKYDLRYFYVFAIVTLVNNCLLWKFCWQFYRQIPMSYWHTQKICAMKYVHKLENLAMHWIHRYWTFNQQRTVVCMTLRWFGALKIQWKHRRFIYIVFICNSLPKIKRHFKKWLTKRDKRKKRR